MPSILQIKSLQYPAKISNISIKIASNSNPRLINTIYLIFNKKGLNWGKITILSLISELKSALIYQLIFTYQNTPQLNFLLVLKQETSLQSKINSIPSVFQIIKNKFKELFLNSFLSSTHFECK